MVRMVRLRRKMSKDASFMIIFGMSLVCIQVKQKSVITADVIGTIQNNPTWLLITKTLLCRACRT